MGWTTLPPNHVWHLHSIAVFAGAIVRVADRWWATGDQCPATLLVKRYDPVRSRECSWQEARRHLSFASCCVYHFAAQGFRSRWLFASSILGVVEDGQIITEGGWRRLYGIRSCAWPKKQRIRFWVSSVKALLNRCASS